MPWKTLEVTSWDHFQRLMSAYPELGTPLITPYLFRGQSDSVWSLTPSLLRHLEPEIGAEEVVEVEEMLLREFRSQSHLYWRFERPDSFERRWEWWALMQHHGVPTRLLDWTASPYVAAYFAVESHWARPGAVFVMHASSLHMATPTYPDKDADALEQALSDPAAEGWVHPFSASRLSERMAAQQGHFTMCANARGDQDEAIAAICTQPPWDDDNALKITIPAELKASFLLQLRAMNVTGHSLFPGADGFGRSLREATLLHAFTDREERELLKEVRVVVETLGSAGDSADSLGTGHGDSTVV